jgi:MFS family permease
VPSRSLSRPAAFWSVAGLLVLLLAASGAPSPLYRVYQERFGFSAGVLTLVFGVYAFALLMTLLVVGALSDHVGRRPVLAAGLLLQAVAMVLFVVADGVGLLLVARVVQGLSTGALTGVLGATLIDFQRRDRPLAPVVNSAGPAVGLGAGAFAAGLALRFAPSPEAWLYGTLAASFVLGALLLVVLPESSPRTPGALAALRPRISVPEEQRSRFWVAVPCLVATWSLGGLYLSLAPSVLAGVFEVADPLSGSLLILAMNGGAAVGAVAVRRWAGRRAMTAGALLFSAGVGVTLGALAVLSVPLLFASAVVSGLGFGTAFYGALTTATEDVAPQARGGLMSAVLTVGYLSFSVPAILAGIAASAVGLRVTAAVYGAVVIALALATVAALLLRRQPGTAPEDVPDAGRPDRLAA